MCSGCSGDYAGGFESDDPEDMTAGPREGATSGSLGEERNTDLSAWHGRGGGSFEVQEDALENCEILVSGTRIVEIRVIPAESHDHDKEELWKVPGAEFSVPGKHSHAASAKYYQTRRHIGETGVRSLGISQCFAGACKAKFKGWLEGTRRLLGKCAPQSS